MKAEMSSETLLVLMEQRKKTPAQRRRGSPRHLESSLQQSCVAWFRMQYGSYGLLLFAVPNGGHRSASEAQRFKAEGVVAGVSDLILLLPRKGYHALCIEMKTEDKSSRQSERQKEWEHSVINQGYLYKVVRSLDEFCELINWYLG